MRNVVIIGSGPAGLTAAIYLSRSGLRPIVISGEKPGGQLVNTDFIENYPGFESISGADLMMKMLSQAEKLGTEIVYESAENVSSCNGYFKIKLSSGEILDSKTILVATGANHKHLGIVGEREFTNKGVSWCATCDGSMYSGKMVAVVGGGNTAVMEALFLSSMAEKVFLIHRRDALRAEKMMQERLFATNNIECLWNAEVSEIIGTDHVNSIKIKNNIDNSRKILDVSAIFIAIGTIPSSGFVKDLLSLDDEGYVISNETKTEIPGIFVAGDIVSGSLKQAIYAAGQGCLASQYIEEYLGVR